MAISLTQLTRANAPKPPRILIHGVAGVGKTTFASEANKSVFVHTDFTEYTKNGTSASPDTRSIDYKPFKRNYKIINRSNAQIDRVPTPSEYPHARSLRSPLKLNIDRQISWVSFVNPTYRENSH